MLHAFASVPALNKFHAENLPKSKTYVMHVNLKNSLGGGSSGKKKFTSTQGSERTSTAPSKILKERYDPNYEPTKEEVDEYAVWLGMDLVQDINLRWIATQGLKRPMPPNWKPCKTPDTCEIYYFNFKTGESTWDHPCDFYDKNLFLEEKKKLNQTTVEDAFAKRVKVANKKKEEEDATKKATGKKKKEETITCRSSTKGLTIVEMKTMLKNLGYTDFRFGLSNVSKRKIDYREMLEIKFKEMGEKKKK